ncbi:MAG TPA: GMC family oxidoreductase N-terminal domain-containing protein [Polyangiaceae bacterium]|nr:GMC family oxidoreductase N-terminal domain-containing protein [Polyangiaceae bacterium]
MNADTVIVGAGSSGAVIAARATETSQREVLLLEAGPDYPDPVGLPADLRDGTRNSMRRHDWGQMHRATPGHKLLFWFPRGRVVGGSSAVNTCIALRGQPHDYDEWASLGLSDWSWANCLPAFKRLENDLDVHGEWHSQTGPLPLRRHPPSELVPWQAAFVEACAAAGFERCDDSNDPRGTGYGPHAMNKIGGERISVARSYLTREVRARDNLRIRPRAIVRRVVLRDRRVVGVDVEFDGVLRRIASRRVVLCAGATATPGILLRSGIGPRLAVERMGVDLVADVPAVGARVLDHPGTAIFLRPKPGVQSLTDPLIQTVLRYTSKGGPGKNDMIVQPGSTLPLPFATLPLVSIMCSVAKAHGFGSIRYASADPRAQPRIESRLLVDERDRDRAVDAMQLAVELARSPPMRDLATFFWPPPGVVAKKDRLREWIGRICDSSYHPCGTVPMGPDGAAWSDAAADGRGRVRGVEGLWVADASLMPTLPSAHTNLTAIMMGERFGEWMKCGEM